MGPYRPCQPPIFGLCNCRVCSYARTTAHGGPTVNLMRKLKNYPQISLLSIYFFNKPHETIRVSSIDIAGEKYNSIVLEDYSQKKEKKQPQRVSTTTPAARVKHDIFEMMPPKREQHQ